MSKQQKYDQEIEQILANTKEVSEHDQEEGDGPFQPIAPYDEDAFVFPDHDPEDAPASAHGEERKDDAPMPASRKPAISSNCDELAEAAEAEAATEDGESHPDRTNTKAIIAALMKEKSGAKSPRSNASRSE